MNVSQILSRFISGVRTLNIPRLEDLPYWTAKPIQFVYESTVNVAGGQYTWADTPSTLVPDRPVLPNVLYYFRSISLTADTEEFEYTTNIVTTPEFRMYLRSDAEAVLFREPILFNKFYDQFDYRLVWESQLRNDQLLAAFSGVLLQGPGLVGKASVTIKAVISAQEITDTSFITLFKQKYPNTGNVNVEPGKK
jgi:hypothetical protein